VQAIHLDAIPLVTGDDGVMRVVNTRVTLDTIVAAFDAGATPEEIVQQYPSVDLAAAYAIIAFVLSRRSEVDSYLARRHEVADDVRSEVEKRFPPEGIRQRLLARRRPA
jgi:uncharacterized protein (DUF433 family)